MKKSSIIIALSALLLGSAAALLHRSGSSEPPFVCHESWAPAQQADLEQLYTLLHHELTKLQQPERSHTLQDKQELLHVLDMLRRVAATGRGDIYTEEGFSAAHLAAHQSMPELLRELVLRGADPNKSHPGMPDTQESVFQSAIACIPLTLDETERLTQPERLELLGWLLNHGADVNQNSGYSLLLTHLADMADAREHMDDTTPGAMIEWLLDHGLQLQDERARKLLCITLHQLGTLPAMQRIVAKGYLPTDDVATLNDLLREAIFSPEEDSAKKARWALALGAQPETAMNLCRSNIMLYGDSADEEDFAHYTAALETLDALLDYGAELQDLSGLIPRDEPQKSLLLEMLEKHGIRP